MSHFIEGRSFAEAYAKLLTILLEKPDHVCKPRGMEIKELIAPTIRITDPTDRLYTSAARSTPMKYLAGEFLWYFSGRHDPEFITKYSAFWNQIKNTESGSSGIDDGMLNSSYGRLAFHQVWADASWNGVPITQWEWSLRSIVRDIDTRQAIVHINRPAHQVDWIKDFPCTMHFQFLVRDGKLHMVVGMRSNDVIKGTTFDIPMFGFFQETMLHNLHQLGQEMNRPDLEGLTLGHLTLVANSSHLYERDYGLAKAMLEGEGIKSLGGSEPLYQPPFHIMDFEGSEPSVKGMPWGFARGDHFSVAYEKAANGKVFKPALGDLKGIYKRIYDAI